MLESARALGITIIAYTPLEWGLLTGKFHDNPDLIKGLPLARRLVIGRKLEESAPVIAALKEIAAQHGATPGQVALNWLVHFNGDQSWPSPAPANRATRRKPRGCCSSP